LCPEKKTSRKLALALCLIAALCLVLAASAPTAEAVSNQNCYYFADAAHTQPVGARGFDCCGKSINWGVTSPYSYCEQRPICVWCPPDTE
jgi:hypothetical protein